MSASQLARQIDGLYGSYSRSGVFQHSFAISSGCQSNLLQCSPISPCIKYMKECSQKGMSSYINILTKSITAKKP